MNISSAALEAILEDAIIRDRTTARRSALLKLLLQERYLTREQLIFRIEGVLGTGCFGDSAWIDTFYRDMHVVKRAMLAAGHQLAYSRSSQQPGYYLREQPSISSELSAALEGSIAEVNRSQIAIFKRLSFSRRFRQGCSISNLARQVVVFRSRQRYPQQSLTESHQPAIRENTQL